MLAFLGLGTLEEIVLFAAVILLVLGAAIYQAILRNLPENLEIFQVDDSEVPRELFQHVNSFTSLGFQRLGPSLTFDLKPAPIMVPLFNPGEGTFATVFKIKTPQVDKTAWDVVSLLETTDSGLTTAMDVGGGALPLPPGSLMQIFPKARASEMVRRHHEALRHLNTQGLRARVARPEDLASGLRGSIRRQRHAFLKARVRHTFIAFWRTVTKSSPYVGPLAQQSGVRKQIEQIRDRGFVREPVGTSF